MKTFPVSEMLIFLVFRIPDNGKKPRNPVALTELKESISLNRI
jgi:hypothetical protein